MRISALVLLTICLGWAQVLEVNVPSLTYSLTDGILSVRGASYIHTPGAPNLPGRTVTIALPPGALVESIDFTGAWMKVGTAVIPPAEPALPLADHGVLPAIMEVFEKQKECHYGTDAIYPNSYGRILSTGGLRKYSLATVVCYHFAYNPVTRELFYTPNIGVSIKYRLPDPASDRARFYTALRNDISLDDVAGELIFNWEAVQSWYHAENPKKADGYTIIMPAYLSGSVDTLISYWRGRGYTVRVVTTEHIDSTTAGVDLVQKIRNYLRANLADIEYVLLVGFVSDVPMRRMVPWANDPDGPYDDTLFSPIPSNLYLAELSDPDSLSWDRDRDGYYGEVIPLEDNPDYHADIHLGKIPVSDAGIITDICRKSIAFDMNTDFSYKAAALLQGGVYYYEGEPSGRWDGAEFMETLMNDGVIDRARAIYLYEKAGLRPCRLSCTDSLSRYNNVRFWQRKGIVYETHHGHINVYARKVWAWDDGDSIPEPQEISWPTSLDINDVYRLDNTYPATAYLRSCLCGHPESYGLSARLLYRGASAIISSSRVAWAGDRKGMPYDFFNRLMKDTVASRGVIGNAFDIARNDFMSRVGLWLCAYHDNLYGDPALKQLGRTVGVAEMALVGLRWAAFQVHPNPVRNECGVSYALSDRSRFTLALFDAAGRLVREVVDGEQNAGYYSITLKVSDLPQGVYFVRLTDGVSGTTKKFVKLE